LTIGFLNGTALFLVGELVEVVGTFLHDVEFAVLQQECEGKFY
jgi:hypothetical protein